MIFGMPNYYPAHDSNVPKKESPHTITSFSNTISKETQLIPEKQYSDSTAKDKKSDNDVIMKRQKGTRKSSVLKKSFPRKGRKNGKKSFVPILKKFGSRLKVFVIAYAGSIAALWGITEAFTYFTGDELRVFVGSYWWLVFYGMPLIGALLVAVFGHPIKARVRFAVDKLSKFKIMEGNLHVTIESVQTGKTHNLKISRKASVGAFCEYAQTIFELDKECDTGTIFPFSVRYVLVDSKAEEVWRRLNRFEHLSLKALIKVGDDVKKSYNDSDKLKDIGVYDGAVFHLHQVEDIEAMGKKVASQQDTAILTTGKRY